MLCGFHALPTRRSTTRTSARLQFTAYASRPELRGDFPSADRTLRGHSGSFTSFLDFFNESH